MRAVALLLALAIGTLPGTAQDVALEYQVKAAYLYNFVKFVHWPATANNGPVNICLASRNPFGTLLAETIRDEIVDGRQLTSRVVLEPEPDCHVLFVPDGAPATYLRSARDTPTLTVGESPDFIQQGGIIGFVKDGRNVRFAINTEAAAHANLEISSRLLRLAVNTRSSR